MIPETPLTGLLTALGIGLLIGLERGWKDRADPDGSRVAGFRTIGLIGFLGGLCALVDTGNGFVIAAGFVALALLLREGFEAQIDVTRIVSVTTMVAALSAYALGAVAVLGHSQAAAAGAVIVAFVLWLRTPLHALLHRIEEKELSAFLRQLLISVVVLPVLPDQAYGPYDAFNPRAIWWMVVLISGLGFVGYLGVKWLGSRRGIGLLALAGSFASSTAVTLSFARFSRNDAGDARALVGGTALAWAGMIVRTAFILGAFAPSLVAPLALPFGSMLVVALAIAAIFLLRRGTQAAPDLVLSNPLDVRSALFFAALLATALLLSRAAADMLGPTGIYGVALVAGAADVDAISLSMIQMSAKGLSTETAAIAVALAAIANTLLKGTIALVAGEGAYRHQCMAVAVFMALAGAAGLGVAAAIGLI
ncbi:DUF4010 domain-containing protein [Hyphomonas sp.]|uniref:MgtC/SapB family protein n=1 Tax=Hyphomonas sp. TaxID=87 RepID=UPI0030FADEEE